MNFWQLIKTQSEIDSYEIMLAGQVCGTCELDQETNRYFAVIKPPNTDLRDMSLSSVGDTPEDALERLQFNVKERFQRSVNTIKWFEDLLEKHNNQPKETRKC